MIEVICEYFGLRFLILVANSINIIRSLEKNVNQVLKTYGKKANYTH